MALNEISFKIATYYAVHIFKDVGKNRDFAVKSHKKIISGRKKMAYSQVCSAYNEDQEAIGFLYREEILYINKFLNWTEKDVQISVQWVEAEATQNQIKQAMDF